MSMEHKAFIFSYYDSENELKPILIDALDQQNFSALSSFFDANIGSLFNLYISEPLPSNWLEQFNENWNETFGENAIQICGDIALTKYYNHDSNIGLSYDWMDLTSEWEDIYLPAVDMTLGNAIGPIHNRFNPGKLGSYFQSPEMVAANLRELQDFVASNPEHKKSLSPLESMLEQAAIQNMGIYTTF